MRRGACLRPLLLPLLASGCTVGPQHPTTPVSLPPVTAPQAFAPANGPRQDVMVGAQPLPTWWQGFGSPALDALVTRALAANNDIANAEAALRQAREQAGVAVGNAGPQADAAYQAQRYKVSRIFSDPLNDPGRYTYTLQTAQLTVTYPLDVFGLQRNRIRSARAAAEVAADRLVAARTTVVANLVIAVITQASLDAQAAATQASVRSNGEILALFQRREALGDIGGVDVAAQQTALATSEAALPPLLRQRDHQRAVIAALIGIAPGNPLPALPTLDQLQLPAALPVALPATIVANRPDVAAAAAQMRGAGADVGAAIAARLPAITLSATGGAQAIDFAGLFASGSPFYALLGSIAQPVFHAGALRHGQHAAEAALEGAKAQYRQAVLLAFTDVNDALVALRTDADALDAAARASEAAQRTLLFTRRQLELGGVGTLATLNAAAASAQASTLIVQARAARLSDTVALYQAVGGSIGG